MATDTTTQTVPQETKSIQNTNSNDLVYIERQSIIRPILFIQDSVKQLREGDFYLDSREYVCLKYDDCIMVLFYGDNTESYNLCKVWAAAASNAVGSIFASCHLGMERRVAENFAKLKDDPSHVLYWARLQQYPFIMVYQKGFPKGFYNGDRASGPLVDYAMTLACEIQYNERNNRFLSVESDNNLEMTGLKVHEGSGRTVSTQFTVSEPLRGYDASFPVKLVDKTEVNPDAVQEPSMEASAPVVANPTDIPQSILRTDTSTIAPPAYTP